MKRSMGHWRLGVSLLMGVVIPLAAASVIPSVSAGASQPSVTPIKIGYLEQNESGQTQIDDIPVFAAWVKSVNAHGGVNGHPVQLISDIEPSNVAIAVTDAQKLIGDGVVAIIDADGNDAAWAPIAEKAGVPVFLSTATLAFGNSDNAFGTVQSPLVTPDEQMLAARKVGTKDLGILYCAEAPQCAQAVAFYNAVAKKFGVNLAYNAAVSESAPNYLSQCLAAKAAGVTILFVASQAFTAQRVVQNCVNQGYSPRLLAASGTFQKSFTTASGTNGMIAPDANVPFFDTSNPAIKAMTEQLNKYDPSITKSAAYDDSAVWNWAIGIMLSEAFKAASLGPSTTITPAAVRDAMFTLHTTNAGGLITPVTFTKGQPETNNCYYLAGIKSGKFTLPYGLKMYCVQKS
jgi:branched-chain amino acid transport system substrate-binding protein